MMNGRFKGALVPAMALMVAACAPFPTPHGEPTRVPPPPMDTPPPERSERPLPPPPVQIIPQQEKVDPAAAAVAGLLQDAWGHYHRDNYDAAIAIAERAQRLDARNPEVYLVLASSYLAQAQLNLAEQLVRKGIAFSGADSGVRGRLQQVLGQIEARSR